MLTYTPYRDIPGCIEGREAFRGHSASAYWADGTYYIYSYETVIASWRDGRWEIDGTYYSRTTSRLQNIVLRVAQITKK